MEKAKSPFEKCTLVVEEHEETIRRLYKINAVIVDKNKALQEEVSYLKAQLAK